MSKEILLVSHNPEDATFCAAIAEALGVSLIAEPDPKSAAEVLARINPVATFIDVGDLKRLRTFESEIQKTVGLFSDKVSLHRMNLVSDRDLNDNREVVLSPLFGTFFKRRKNLIEDNAKNFARYVSACENLGSGDISRFLKDGANIQSAQVLNTSLKLDAVEAVKNYLGAAGFTARIANLIANAVDELLMNAMYDAPVDEFGKNLYTMTSRNQARKLEGKGAITLTLGFDGEFVCISVTDNYGSVDRQRLLNHVSANYNRRAYMISATNAGAGLGVANVFRSGGSLIYLVESRVRTEVTLLYSAAHNYRDFKSQFRFFSAQFMV
jgi:hypothetical protein